MKKTYEQLVFELGLVPEKKVIFRHYKTGDIYTIVGCCVREHDQEVCVLYSPTKHPNVVFCRPLKEWDELVDGGDGVNNLMVSRFSYA